MSDSIPVLTPTDRRALQARAHLLKPVVLVGMKGLTDAVLKEVDVALRSHELIKVRLAAADRAEREAQLRALSEGACAALIQHIGKIIVLYRKRPEASEQADTLARTTGKRSQTRPRPGTRAARETEPRPRMKGSAQVKRPAARRNTPKRRLQVSSSPRSR